MTAGNEVRSGFREAVISAHDTLRPVLLRLNADTSFLLSFSYPADAPLPTRRCRYNVLIDPWLQGPQSDVASWFSTQWHAIDSSIKTIQELNDIIRHAETACLKSDEETGQGHVFNYIDAVAISHEFTDHCHEATLRELDRSVPVFAAAKAVELIKSWKHFDDVFHLPPFRKGTDWRQTSVEPLPSWLGISRLITEGNSLYYHSAIIFCTPGFSADDAEAIIYTPHGVELKTFSAFADAKPGVEVLALMHGLHDVSLRWSKQLNLGAHNALKVQRILRAKYWVATHDEVKRGGGIITPILQRKAHTLQDALSKEQKESKHQVEYYEPEDVAFVDLNNGQSLVLV